MELARDLSQLLSLFEKEKSQKFPGTNLTRKALEDDLPQVVQQWLRSLTFEDWLVEGSIGKGNWASVPWLAILNPTITPSVSRGVYIVFLLCGDSSGLFLCLGSGTGGISKSEVPSEYKHVLQRVLTLLIGNLPNFERGEIKKGDLKGFGQRRPGAYEQATVLHRYYSAATLTSNDNTLVRDLEDLVGIFASLEKYLLDFSPTAMPIAVDFTPKNIVDERKKVLAQIVLRQGQLEFRRDLMDAYDKRCAITGCDFPGALEAAHIVPYMGPDTNHVSNGLLLRADIHTLFDLAFITIDPDTYKIRLAKSLTGTCYEDLSGKRIILPKDSRFWPGKERGCPNFR